MAQLKLLIWLVVGSSLAATVSLVALSHRALGRWSRTCVVPANIAPIAMTRHVRHATRAVHQRWIVVHDGAQILQPLFCVFQPRVRRVTRIHRDSGRRRLNYCGRVTARPSRGIVVATLQTTLHRETSGQFGRDLVGLLFRSRHDSRRFSAETTVPPWPVNETCTQQSTHIHSKITTCATPIAI